MQVITYVCRAEVTAQSATGTPFIVRVESRVADVGLESAMFDMKEEVERTARQLLVDYCAEQHYTPQGEPTFNWSEEVQGMTKQELIELLSDKEHASWARWMAYVFRTVGVRPDGSVTIPKGLVAHWQQQVDTPYEQLTEREKQSDRDEVAHILPIIERYLEENNAR